MYMMEWSSVSRLADVADLWSHAAREVDQRLALIFGRMRLDVGVEDGALGLARLGQQHLVCRAGTAQQPGDEAILAFVDRRGAALAPHRAIDGFDGHLAGKGRGIGLPARDRALARLARG